MVDMGTALEHPGDYTLEPLVAEAFPYMEDTACFPIRGSHTTTSLQGGPSCSSILLDHIFGFFVLFPLVTVLPLCSSVPIYATDLNYTQTITRTSARSHTYVHACTTTLKERFSLTLIEKLVRHMFASCFI